MSDVSFLIWLVKFLGDIWFSYTDKYLKCLSWILRFYSVQSVEARFGTYLAKLLQVELQWLHVHVEAQRGHGKQDVLPVDGLPLLLVAALAGFWRDEADELTHTLLHTLLCVFCNLDRKHRFDWNLLRRMLLHDKCKSLHWIMLRNKKASFTNIFILNVKKIAWIRKKQVHFKSPANWSWGQLLLNAS